jgi:hypothetical protein
MSSHKRKCFTKFRLICLIFLLLITAGCSSDRFPNIPETGISAEHLNKELKLTALPAFNTFKIGESINLELRLESNLEVEVSPESDTKIFYLNSETNEWQQVQEIPDLGVFEPQTFVLSLKDNGINEISISLYPSLPIGTKPIYLLIIVTGNVIQEGKVGNRKVGAYIIVKLTP